jgi:hypothetical protein
MHAIFIKNFLVTSHCQKLIVVAYIILADSLKIAELSP